MNLVIWQWSTAVQLSSVALISLFFVVLARSVRVADLRWWVAAWLANVLALAVAVAFWVVQPQSDVVVTVLRALYMGGKTAFVVCLIQGAWLLKRPGRPLLPLSAVLVLLAAYAVVGGLFVDGIDELGLVQQGVLGLLFLVGTLLLLRRPYDADMSWMLAGFAIRSVLGFVESAAYGVTLAPAGTFAIDTVEQASTITAVHSSFDSGTEWLIALGCVLWLSRRSHRELAEYNTALLDAQEELRRIADRDPLTGLANRRGLRAVLQGVRDEGATLLFFDLDGFKAVNDLLGHQAGDRCLRRFADALRECFRADDEIIRYAGDEFLVVAQRLDAEGAQARIAELRDVLAAEAPSFGPPIRFSVGVAELEPGGQPEEALQAADDAMYGAKESVRDARRASMRAV